jgi:mutual gliding-motility protein MglA
VQIRVKLFTVPGQVIHNATRRLVLQGADGVAFIADSQRTETKANQIAFVNMRENLLENGLDAERFPVVIQFNKRDMPDVRSDEELDRMAQRGREPVFKAVALRGSGVMETFYGLLELTWGSLEAEHQLADKFGIDPQTFFHEVRTRIGAPEVP